MKLWHTLGTRHFDSRCDVNREWGISRVVGELRLGSTVIVRRKLLVLLAGSGIGPERHRSYAEVWKVRGPCSVRRRVQVGAITITAEVRVRAGAHLFVPPRVGHAISAEAPGVVIDEWQLGFVRDGDKELLSWIP